MVKKLLIVLVLALPFQLFAQNVYHLKYHADIPVAAIGLGTFASSWFTGKNTVPLTLEQVSVLNRDDIWRFDRSACNRWSPGAAKASDYLLYSSILAPSLLFINENVRKERYTSIIYLETMMLSMGLNALIKEVSTRTRPYAYNERAGDSRMGRDARRSFYSGHTSIPATAFFFMAKTYSDLNPDSHLKPYVWTAAALVPAVVGVLRYTAGKHYPTDIITGYLTGAAIGMLVPQLHKRRASKR